MSWYPFIFTIREVLAFAMDKPEPTFDEIVSGPRKKPRKRPPRHWSGSWLHG